MKKRFYDRIIALAVVFSLVFTPVSVLATENKDFTANVENPAMNSANWMGFLPNGTKLKAINIPAAHDAGTAEIMRANISKELVKAFIGIVKNTDNPEKGWGIPAALAIRYLGPFLLAGLSPALIMAGLVGNRSLSPFAQDQALSIPDQLRQGIRILDCRVSNYTNDEHAPWRDCLVFSHGGFKCIRNDRDLTMAQVIEDARAFLKENPTETVILGIQKENFAFTLSSEATFVKEIMEALNKVVHDALGCKDLSKIGDNATEPVDNMMKELGDRSQYPDVIVGNPCELTLGETRGKIIITDKGNIDTPSGTEIGNYNLNAEKKWKALEAYYKSAEDPNAKEYAPLNYSNPEIAKKIAEASCTGGNKLYVLTGLIAFLGYCGQKIVPWRSGADAHAMFVNPKILSYPFIKGIHYGWLYMDFVNEALAKKIYESNVFDFNVAGQPLEYISDIRISYDQNINSAQDHFNNTGYNPFADDFNEDGIDKVLSGAIVNGVKNDGSFNIAVAYLTSQYPKDAITGLIWTQKEWESSALPDNVKQLLNDYHFILVDPLSGKNAVQLIDEDKEKITTSEGFASFNIGTKGYVTNLLMTRDSAFGERLISLDSIPSVNKILPPGLSPDMQEDMRQSINADIEKRFKEGKEMPRDVDGNVFASNFGRGANNDVYLMYDTAFNNGELRSNYRLRGISIHIFDEYLGQLKLRPEPK